MTNRRFLGPVALMLLAGCGGGVNPNAPATVMGTVTYNRSPVTAGTISFHPTDGAANRSTMPIAADGTFSTTDVPAGEMIVTVETESANQKKQVYGGGQTKDKQFSPVPEGATVGARGAYVKIPPKYADKSKSDLKATLRAGKQTVNFDLVD
jgi:hypothetical protein